MQIKKLTTAGIVNAKAYTFVKKDNMYFNIKHGSYGDGLWVWTCGVNKNKFSPEKEDDVLVLDRNDYILVPVKRNGEVVRDKKGNIIYSLTIDYMEHHKNDILLLWEIPNRNYKEVSYKVNGECNEVGKGFIGKDVRGTSCVSPAPVIEIFGDVELEWCGVSVSGNVYSQKIKYDYTNKKWEIGPIKNDKGECDG